MDIIGQDLVDRYPEYYERVAANEWTVEMPVCPVCGIGDCVHQPTEDEMSARRQRTEDKSAKPMVAEDKARVDAGARSRPDPFEGTYESLEHGRIRFVREVSLVVPAPGGATTRVLVAPVGMVQPVGWLARQRAFYGLS